MIDDLEQLYDQGCQAGLTGVRQKCPEEIYMHEDRGLRGAWIEGYLEGLREYKRRMIGYDRTSIHQDSAVKGALYFDLPDPFGWTNIRDCEAGTILCKYQLNPEPRIIIPRHNVTPEMAHVLGRALAKASGLMYRVKMDRELRPAKRSDVRVPPVVVQHVKQHGANSSASPEADAYFSLSEQAHTVGKLFKKLYWFIRQQQPIEDVRGNLAEGMRQLVDDYNKITEG